MRHASEREPQQHRNARDSDDADYRDDLVTWQRDDIARCARLEGMLTVIDRVAADITERDAQATRLASLMSELSQEVAALSSAREHIVDVLNRREQTLKSVAGDRDRYEARVGELTRTLWRSEQQIKNKDGEVKSSDAKRKLAEAALGRALADVQRLHRAARAQRKLGVSNEGEARSQTGGRLEIAFSKAKEVLRGASPPQAATILPAQPQNDLGTFKPETQLLGNERDDVVAATPQPLRVPIGRAHAAYARSSLPVVAFLVFGREPQAIEAAIERIIIDFGERPWCTPLFITDAADFSPFRQQGYAFEYLPGEAARRTHAPDLDWPLYFARRAVALRNKWKPASTIVLGAEPPFDPELLCEPTS